MKKINKLLEAYNLLKDYCEGRKHCEECVFFNPDNDECSLETVPSEWSFCRYSKDEADLADILQKYGVESITKINGNVFWKNSDLLGGVLPKGLFCSFEEDEEIAIEEIAKYSER